MQKAIPLDTLFPPAYDLITQLKWFPCFFPPNAHTPKEQSLGNLPWCLTHVRQLHKPRHNLMVTETWTCWACDATQRAVLMERVEHCPCLLVLLMDWPVSCLLAVFEQMERSNKCAVGGFHMGLLWVFASGQSQLSEWGVQCRVSCQHDSEPCLSSTLSRERHACKGENRSKVGGGFFKFCCLGFHSVYLANYWSSCRCCSWFASKQVFEQAKEHICMASSMQACPQLWEGSACDWNKSHDYSLSLMGGGRCNEGKILMEMSDGIVTNSVASVLPMFTYKIMADDGH